MVIYDIPKEFRNPVKLDLSFNYSYIYAPLSYISIRDKGSNEELAFYCMNIPFCVDIFALKDSFKEHNISVSVIFDSRNSNNIDYYNYDVKAYKNTDFLTEV